MEIGPSLEKFIFEELGPGGRALYEQFNQAKCQISAFTNQKTSKKRLLEALGPIFRSTGASGNWALPREIFWKQGPRFLFHSGLSKLGPNPREVHFLKNWALVAGPLYEQFRTAKCQISAFTDQKNVKKATSRGFGPNL